MENGYDEKLAEKFSGLGINQNGQHVRDQPTHSSDNNNNDNLFQVMKAVEAAEATIKQQVDENNQLRSELLSKIQELEKYRLYESLEQKSHPVAPWKEPGHGSYEARQSFPSSGNHFENSQINGTPKMPNYQLPVDNVGHSQLSSPFTRSISPSRHLPEGDNDSRFSSPQQGLMPMPETNNSNSLLKQDLTIKVREHEEEIILLRKHLADYSAKEAQIRNEKYVLEKRIAYMRLAFDQQQQDLVDAASKALSYRQDIIEENIRLTYALQDAQQERSTFVSSLLPLLAEYSLQPPVPDAQSIVSNVKVLFKHLQEKLFRTESKLKESQYQLTPWHSDINHANVATQSPLNSIGAPLATSNKNSLELVPQHRYSQVMTQAPVDPQTGTGWDAMNRYQSGMGGGLAANVDADDLGRYSPLGSRNSSAHDVPNHQVVTQGDSQNEYYGELSNKQVTFRDPVSHNEVEDLEGDGDHSERETPANWSSGNPSYTTSVDDPGSSYSPYLPPVLEEPSSSFSEAADDDPLPAIEGLQISGEAFPGRELQACGYKTEQTLAFQQWHQRKLSIISLKKKTLESSFVRDESERPKVSYNDFSNEIPIISLAGIDDVDGRRTEICNKIVKACENWGIFQVVDHGVDSNLISEMTRFAKMFFDLPPEEKLRFDMSGGKKGGFIVSSHLQGESVKDWRELVTYFSYPIKQRDYSRWPDKPEGWKEVTEQYSENLMSLACKLLEVLSEAMGLEKEALTKACVDMDQKVVVNYYPKCPQPDLTLGLKRHTDPGTITLLLQDQVGGLQATKDNGKTWITVQPVEGAFVVNLGDHGHYLSNGRFKNADHQAVVNSNYSRLSIATFQNPAPDATVYPLKIREGEKSVLEEPITFTDMYRRKMSKDLEIARMKKLAKEKEIRDSEKVKLETKPLNEILA